jgi:superfamily I DNA/RNA helicase
VASDLLKHLNPEQLQAALCREHCLVVAPPGSGKTGTLAAKAATLLREGKTRVAAVTFTRDSALELRHRILKLAGEEALPRVMVGTFHSIDMLMAFPKQCKSGMGIEILRDMISPFTQKWSLVSNGARAHYILRAAKDAGIEAELPELSKNIEEFKASGIVPVDKKISDLLSGYKNLLQRNGEIDFQDILLLTNDALRNGAMTPLPVDFLLLDEYQDTDVIQFEWAKFHGVRSKITAVGDDDQAIYGFRKALGHGGMMSFENHFRAEKIILGTNYRSRSEILSAAGAVIGNNSALGRVEKRLFAAKGPGGGVIWDRFSSGYSEADACANYAAKILNKDTSVAVIARTNRRLEMIHAYMVWHEVPCKRPEGSLFDSPEFALYQAILMLWTKQTKKSMELHLSWMGLTHEDFEEIFKLFGTKLIVPSVKDFKNSNVTDEGKKLFREFNKLALDWLGLEKKALYTNLFEGINSWLDRAYRDKRALARFVLCQKIFTPKSLADGSKQSFIERVTQINDLAKPLGKKDEAKEEPQCILLTAHGAKGLEFDHVWIVGAEEEVFPDKDGGLEEERRLFYVAMTRAKEQLVITTHGSRDVSRFITESKIPRAEVDYFKPVGAPLGK